MSKLRKALTKWVQVRKGRRNVKVEVQPSDRLIYGVYFAIGALVCLTILEAIHIVVLRSFSSEIFAGIALVVGTILGAFFGQRA